jgi:predicted Zn-dependent protease
VFDTGLPLAPTEWMSDGVMRALVQTRHTALRSGQPVTPEIGNLVLSGPGHRSLPEMIARTRRGLVITSLWYLRDVDPRRLLLTGTTRDGVHLVEDGEVVAAANDFRLNESPVEVLGRVTEVGRTEPALPREWGDADVLTAMPPLRVPSIHLSPAGALP